MSDRAKSIRRASVIGILGNLFLAILKLVAGIISGSLSVVADGVDSCGDVFISFITLYIATLLSKPPNIKFPYGYGRAEANATVVLSFLIFFAGMQLALSSGKRLISGTAIEMPGMIAIVAIVISIFSKFGLASYQRYMGKRTQSNMLIAYSKNMQSDVIISASVLTGLILTHVFKLPILDSIVALLVSIWVIWVAIKIFLETNLELMDGNIEKDIYKKVFDLVESIEGVKNPHRMRIRRVGNKLMINIDIELDGELTLKEAHDISHKAERKIRKELEHDVFDVVIHIEPFDDTIKEEEIGVSRDVLNGSK
ncbi:MAG: cation transporter [Bacteroidales bacterium]|nr:cation transporter [Bacteroidales bacterium]